MRADRRRLATVVRFLDTVFEHVTDFLSANTSVGSPRKIFIFNVKNTIYWIKVSQKLFIGFWKQHQCMRVFLEAARSRIQRMKLYYRTSETSVCMSVITMSASAWLQMLADPSGVTSCPSTWKNASGPRHLYEWYGRTVSVMTFAPS